MLQKFVVVCSAVTRQPGTPWSGVPTIRRGTTIMGVCRNFSKREKSTFCLSFSGFWRCNASGRTQNALLFLHHKENAQCYGNGCKQCSF